MIVWDIYETRAGTFDVQKSRRAFAYDLDDQETAERKIKKSRYFHPDQPVILHTNDGLRKTIKI